MTFNLNKELIVTDEAVIEANCRFINFLKTLKEQRLLNGKNETGLILYADDQYVNRQAIKMTFEDVGLSKRLVMFQNGQEVLEFLERYQDNHEQSDQNVVYQPISLLLLDINMPVLNGLQTLPLVKKRFADLNETMKVQRPLICYLTQFEESFQQLVTENEKADLFLQKPLP